MPIYDFVMIAVLLGAVIFGAWKGLAWQLASLASLVASYFVALRFSGQLAPYITDRAPLNRFLAMLVIYVTCSFVIWIAFRFVSRFIDRLKLREFDRQMGALAGLAKGILLCVAITFFAVSLTESPVRDSILTSRSGHYIGHVIDRAHIVMPREIHDVLDPYLHQLDQQLEHDHVDLDQHGNPIDEQGHRHAQDHGSRAHHAVPAAIP